MPRTIDYSTWDEVVVQRLLIDQKPYALVGDAERAEAVRRLAGRGYSDGQIAHLVGVYRRTVQRIRSKHKIPSLLPEGTNQGNRPVDAPARQRSRG